MTSVFYDHLINIHELHLEFDRLNIPVKDRNELMEMADSTVHHEVFDLVMVEIPSEHKTYFLELFSTDPGHPELFTFVSGKIPDFETKVKDRINMVKDELINEVRKLI